MPFILVLLLSSVSLFAQSRANCELTTGIYKNSKRTIDQLQFETVVDVFSINNAHNLSFDLDGENWRFDRRALTIKDNTYMVFVSDKSSLPRAAYVMLEGQPAKMFKDKFFRGNILITPEMKSADIQQIAMMRKDLLAYNFNCSF